VAKTHENEANASRDRGHKIWPRGHIGLEDLTSLMSTWVTLRHNMAAIYHAA